jgi:hypothetical protein
MPICFVDSRGGALSVLAACVARSLGVDAVAATSTTPSDIPGEIATVLEEVAMAAPGQTAVALGSLERGADAIVFLGANPPADLPAKVVWDVALFYGPGELERLAFARIARDQIERGIEAMRRS